MQNSKMSNEITELLKQVSLAAHDLNNVLSVANGYPDLLLNLPYDEKRTHFFLEQIKIAMYRASDSTKLLLALGRCAEPDLQAINLQTLLNQWLNSVHEKINSVHKEVAVIQNSEADSICVQLSEPVFKQLLNIILDKFQADNDVEKLEISFSLESCNEVKISYRFTQAGAAKPFKIDNSNDFAVYVAGMIIASLEGRMLFNTKTENLEIYLKTGVIDG